MGQGVCPVSPAGPAGGEGSLLGSLWLLTSWSLSVGLEGQHGGPWPARPPGPPRWRGRPGEWLCQQGCPVVHWARGHIASKSVEPPVYTTATSLQLCFFPVVCDHVGSTWGPPCVTVRAQRAVAQPSHTQQVCGSLCSRLLPRSTQWAPQTCLRGPRKATPASRHLAAGRPRSHHPGRGGDREATGLWWGPQALHWPPGGSPGSPAAPGPPGGWRVRLCPSLQASPGAACHVRPWSPGPHAAVSVNGPSVC